MKGYQKTCNGIQLQSIILHIFGRTTTRFMSFLQLRVIVIPSYITACTAYLHTLADMFFLWQTQIITSNSLNGNYFNQADQFTLDNQQQTIHNHISAALSKRAIHYSSFARINTFHSDSDSEDLNFAHESLGYHDHPIHPSEQINVLWNKPVLVTGQAGCGKSYLIQSIVNHLIEKDASVLVAAPTGFLASVFRTSLPDEVNCETVHASFHFPVEDIQSPSINWQLSNYDIIIIDEISMIPNIIFKHILKTLNVLLFRPVLMLCGDAGQQQPFSRHNGKIMQINSPFDETSFIHNTYHYNLTNQHRVGDTAYLSFLNTIRKWVPTQELLDEIQNGRIISQGETVTNEDIINAYFTHPDNTVLTFTKNAANHINTIIVHALFSAKQPLLYVQVDCELPPMPIYRGMRIVITQNRDKPNGIVNGQLGWVHMVQNKSVFVKFNNGKIVAIYPVTTKRDNICTTVYPFVPAYATTMCKAQGQTLTKVILWFDIEKIPAGTAYVALSRVRSQNNIFFLNRLKPNYFTPVSRLNHLL